MKRVILVGLVVLMIASLCMSVSADEFSGYTYNFGEITVVFEDNTPFDEEQRQRLSEYIVYGNDNISTYGFNILCLFGHNYEVGNIRTITHCVRDTSPRCLEEYFEIGECTRCGNTYTELLGSVYIPCCP